MKALKLFVAGLLVMGLSTPVMAQDVNYKNLLKPIETSLKSGASTTTSKDLEKLVKDYQKTFKKSPDALVALGNQLVIAKDYDKASEIANGVIAKYKNCGDAYILLGDIASLKDNGGEAATWYHQAIEMEPKNPKGYLNYARVYSKIDPQGVDNAIKNFKSISPDYPIEANVADNFYSAGNYEKAYDYFSKASKSKLSEYELYEYISSAYFTNKKEETLSLATEAINKYPAGVNFKRFAVWAGVDLQQFEQAAGYAESIMTTDSVKKSARDYTYYGLALAGTQKYAEAIEQYNKALEMKADDPKPLQYISEVYKSMGEEDKALEYNQQYMDKNPNAAPTDFMKLAEIYVAKAKKEGEDKVANIDKAINVYAKLAEKYPVLKAFAKLQEGNTAFQNELDDKAIPAYTEVITELEAKQCEADEIGYLKQAYQYMGFIYLYDKQDAETAKPYFEKLLKLDPENKLATDAMAKIAAEEAK